MCMHIKLKFCDECLSKVEPHGELCEELFIEISYLHSINEAPFFHDKGDQFKKLNPIIKFMEQKKLIVSTESSKNTIFLKLNLDTFKSCNCDSCAINILINRI